MRGNDQQLRKNITSVARTASESWADQMADDMDIVPVEHAIRGGADHNIQVLVRVRPPNSRELEQVSLVPSEKEKRNAEPFDVAHPRDSFSTTQGYVKGVHTSGQSIDVSSKSNAKYSYDHVYDHDASQLDIFESVGVPVTDAFLEGYHGCLIAYGQTGAGKTFTMQGPDDHTEIENMSDETSVVNAAEDPEQLGLIPRVLKRIFAHIENEKAAAENDENAGDVNNDEVGSSRTPGKSIPTRGKPEVEFTVKCSYLEIYNETMADLLGDPGSAVQPNIREHEKKGVFVEGLTEAPVYSAEETYELFQRGSHRRRVGMTEMNRESSRSHSVFTVSLESRRRAFAGAALQKRSALLHLVDLAGSERQKSTESAGARLKEASAINKSLSALGNVIKALVDVADGKDRHVPYRDSKLTFLLKEALGGKARCTLLACVSPAAGQVEETLSTLKFAQRAKLVKVTASKNEEAVGSVAELAAEVTRLRNMLSEGTGEGADRARLRANDLELHIARANRVAAATARAAAQETEKLSGRLVEVQELASRLDKNLQSTKMVLRLKEARLSKGTKSVENTDSEEMESLRKMAECPPEVIRMRIEMQQLRHQIEQLEAENGIHPAKGKMIQLEKEMKELRAVRLEEGELVAQTIEDRAAADAAREETEHVNEILEAQRNASERAAALSEDAAANADAARAEAALAQVNAEAKQKIAEENMFRVQATFDEQKCVMEEMFGQIEKLDALRTRLEQQLAEANLASEAARVEAAETKEVLTAITDAKNVIEAEAAAAAQRHDQECARKDDELIRMKAAHRIEISEIEKSHAALLVATTEIREGEMEKLVASHDKMVTEMKDVHTKEVAASAETHSIDLAKQRTDIENLAHEALMKEKQSHDGRVAKLEAAHAQAIQVKMKEHRDTIAELSANHEAAFVSKREEYKAAIADVAANADARAAAAAAELEVMESAHKAAVAEAATAHLTELNEVRAAHDESIETLRRAHGQELEEMKSKHAEQLTDQRLKMEAAAAKSSEEAEKHESALSDVQKTVETLKAELLDVKATHEVEVADLETMHKDEMKKLEDGYKGEIVKVQSAATEIASAREGSLANQVATAEKASELASLEAAETIAAMEIAKTAAMEELKATHAAALDAAKQSCASALQAADAEKILAVQAVKDSASRIAEDIHQKHDAALVEVEARVKMAAAKSAEEDMATALNAAKKDKVAALQALEISHEKALHSLHAELNDRLHTEMDTLIAQAENEKIAAVAAAMESNASDAVEKLEKAHAEEIRELEMKHAEVLAKAAEEQALAVSIKLKEAIKEADSRAHSTLTKQRETLESAAKAGMRAQEKMLASAEEKLASMKAELSSATEAGKAAEARAAKVEAAAKAAVIAAKAQLDSVREENAKEHALELEALRASLEEEAKLGHRSAASSDGKVLELQSIIARLSAELAAAKNSIDVAEPPKTASKRGRSKCAATPEAKRDDTFEKSVTRSAAKGRKPLSSRSTNAGVGEDDSSAELVPTKRAKSTPKAAVLLDESL